MIEIAKLPVDDRRELFHNTAAKTGLHDAIVEKDFWVCLTLDYLFHRSPWKKSVTFKGGTSLSKGYHLISRFSEDIDLILDWRVLGYEINEISTVIQTESGFCPDSIAGADFLGKGYDPSP